MNRPRLKSIKSKIIWTTLVFTLSIALFIVSICFFSFHNLLSDSIVSSTKFNLQLIMNSFSSNMEPIINFSNWCNNKNAIINYLTSPAQTSSTALPVWKQLKEEYLTNVSAHYINRIVICDLSGHYLQINSVPSFNASRIPETISSFPFFEEACTSSHIKWNGFIFDPFSDTKGEQIIPIIRGIYTPNQTTQIGWSYISVSSSLIANALSQYDIPQDSNLLLTIDNQTYSLQENTFISQNTGYKTIDQITHNNYIITKIKAAPNQMDTYITVPCSIKGWYLTQKISKKEFADQRKLYILLIILICFVVLSIGIALAIYLNRVINQPLDAITHKMALISKGDFSYEPSIEWDNELGDIGKGINELSKNVSQLIHTRIAVEKEKKELEYQILQSQINPHFLYNTLNSIKWMATIQQATGIGEMTTALARLMGAVSKDTKQIVTLKDEISLLDNYFLIQKYRYGGTLTLNYDIQEECLYDCQILKFTLQPIVENAIFHGIGPKGTSGTITVNASKRDKDLFIIKITDNGIGMSQEQVDHMLSDDAHDKSEFFKQIGVNNVHQRIQYTFGPSYGLSFSSKVDHYTTVQITLPLILTNPTVKECK